MNKKQAAIWLAVLAVFFFAGQTRAQTVIVVGDSNIQSNTTFFSNVFIGADVFARGGGSKPWLITNWDDPVIAVANSFTNSATLTAGDLVGIDWVIIGTNAALSGAELTALNDFLSSGGNVWVTGEYGSAHDDASTVANAVLASLGSGISVNLGTNVSDDATNIAVHPFTTGVTSWSGAASAAVSLAGGTALVTNDNGDVLVAVEGEFAPPPPTEIAQIPTMSGYGLIITGLGLVLVAVRRLQSSVKRG